MPPNKKLEADRHNADVERGFSAQNLICTSQRLSSYVSDTQSKIIALIWSLELLFDYFWVTLIVWSAIQPQWALFFPFHNNFCWTFRYIIFCFALCMSMTQNTGKLPPWNWYRHNVPVSTILKLEKQMYCFMRLNGLPNSKCCPKVSRNGGQMRQKLWTLKQEITAQELD